MSTRSGESSEAGSLQIEDSSSVSNEEHKAANPNGASKIKYALITLIIIYTRNLVIVIRMIHYCLSIGSQK